jgi:hypothetical protein
MPAINDDLTAKRPEQARRGEGDDNGEHFVHVHWPVFSGWFYARIFCLVLSAWRCARSGVIL